MLELGEASVTAGARGRKILYPSRRQGLPSSTTKHMLPADLNDTINTLALIPIHGAASLYMPINKQ